MLIVSAMCSLGGPVLAEEPIVSSAAVTAVVQDTKTQPDVLPEAHKSATAAEQQPAELPVAAAQSTPIAVQKAEPPYAPKPTAADSKSEKKAAPNIEKTTAKTQTADKKAWRRDKSVPRRPGSYLGGGIGYSMVNSWYTVEQKDLKVDYDIGPVHGYMFFLRVGDALFEWLSVGFQIDMIGAALAGVDEPGASAFGLYVDTTFYPWRGLGLRPSVGVGFGYAQAGKETYELGYGGPLTLAFAASYEFRVSRGFTMGPMFQVSWVKGENFDAVFFNVGLEFIKWFKTAKG
jgi:hypothetical protein